MPVTSEFTKQLLIEKILQFWKNTFYLSDDGEELQNEQTEPIMNAIKHTAEPQLLDQTTVYTHHISNNSTDQPEHFPINQMALKFATWFYENLNLNRLQVSDFWCNCKCMVQFLENQLCLMEEEHLGAQSVLEFCQSLLSTYNLYFNLNISHSGTQGRIDCHGLGMLPSTHHLNFYLYCKLMKFLFNFSFFSFGIDLWNITQSQSICWNI